MSEPIAAPDGAPPAKPRIISRSEHTVSRQHISQNALRVLYRLNEAGYEAFLVGGCVRDLLLNHEPKDFDVATNALPEEVKRLFRNCRLVGRRFRLAHVFFGREIIEVATFRASTAPSQGEEAPDEPEESLGDADIEADAPVESEAAFQHVTEEEVEETLAAESARAVAAAVRGPDDDTERVLDVHGRILRDNVYGSIDDDVWRRDFTCNSLYYNIGDFSIWDYVEGVRDIDARLLRLIGDPATRYREDPVRMLRAARFEAKLGFTLEPATEAPIAELRHLLAKVPPARLFDETLKLFLTGHGVQSLEVLRRRGLLGVLFPNVAGYLDRNPGSLVEQLLLQGLTNTDQRVRADKPVTPTFLFALLLYGPIAQFIESLPPERWAESGTIMDACDAAVRDAQERVTIPRRFSLGVREMFALQPRLEHPRGKRALRLLEHPRFRAAYDLLLLRAQLGMASTELAQWWTHVQEAGGEQRAQMFDQLESTSRSQKGGSGRTGVRRRRRRRRPSGAA